MSLFNDPDLIVNIFVAPHEHDEAIEAYGEGLTQDQIELIESHPNEAFYINITKEEVSLLFVK